MINHCLPFRPRLAVSTWPCCTSLFPNNSFLWEQLYPFQENYASLILNVDQWRKPSLSNGSHQASSTVSDFRSRSWAFNDQCSMLLHCSMLYTRYSNPLRSAPSLNRRAPSLNRRAVTSFSEINTERLWSNPQNKRRRKAMFYRKNQYVQVTILILRLHY